MTTQIAVTVLYAAVAAGVVFQVATAARVALRTARKGQPLPPPARPRRFRPREYRLALRAAKASVFAKS